MNLPVACPNKLHEDKDTVYQGRCLVEHSDNLLGSPHPILEFLGLSPGSVSDPSPASAYPGGQQVNT